MLLQIFRLILAETCLKQGWGAGARQFCPEPEPLNAFVSEPRATKNQQALIVKSVVTSYSLQLCLAVVKCCALW